MEIRHMRYFEAVAQTLSFTAAAVQVHAAQSTISHQIRQLEDEIGKKLFLREGKFVSLTEAGELFLSQVSPALRTIDQLGRLFSGAPKPPTSSLRIGATQGFTARVIPQCMALFLKRFPSIQLFVEELSNNDIVERVESGAIDVGVGYRPHDLSAVWFKPLYNEELMLLVQANHPYARRRKLQMRELQGLRMVMLPTSFSTRQILDECLRTADAVPTLVAEMSSLTPMIELIRKTDLAGVLAYSAITDHTGLAVIPIENPIPSRTPGLLLRKTGKRETATDVFGSIVREVTDELNLQRPLYPVKKRPRKS